MLDGIQSHSKHTPELSEGVWSAYLGFYKTPSHMSVLLTESALTELYQLYVHGIE